MSKHSKSVAKVSAEFTGSGNLDAELAEAAEAAETNPDAPITDRSTVTRGHARSKVLQVRLNQDEFDAIESLAERRQLPVSNIAREQLLKLIATDDAPTDRLAQLQSSAEMLANFVAELRTARGRTQKYITGELDADANVITLLGLVYGEHP
jgi:predicted DNA-binding ribbon-helix-helix protein